MENVTIHGMDGNDAYKVVPKYKKISKINEITIHHVYLNRGVLRSPLNLSVKTPWLF